MAREEAHFGFVAAVVLPCLADLSGAVSPGFLNKKKALVLTRLCVQVTRELGGCVNVCILASACVAICARQDAHKRRQDDKRCTFQDKTMFK